MMTSAPAASWTAARETTDRATTHEASQRQTRHGSRKSDVFCRCGDQSMTWDHASAQWLRKTAHLNRLVKLRLRRHLVDGSGHHRPPRLVPRSTNKRPHAKRLKRGSRDHQTREAADQEGGGCADHCF